MRFWNNDCLLAVAVKLGRRRRCEPDWTALARELKRPGVNLMVLWEEYRQVHPDGYGYSRYLAIRPMWYSGAIVLARCGVGALVRAWAALTIESRKAA